MAIRVGDIGITFKITITDSDSNIVNLASFTTLQVIFQKPDNSTVTKTASLLTDGTDGIIVYITVDGDLNLHGLWCVQAQVSNSSKTYKSSIGEFRVERNIL